VKRSVGSGLAGDGADRGSVNILGSAIAYLMRVHVPTIQTR
jgi:hypothetical protein